MRDTHESVHRRMIAMMKNVGGKERLKMGASMFDMAKKLVEASLRPQDNKKIGLFLRFYGGDYSAERRERIVRYLHGNHR